MRVYHNAQFPMEDILDVLYPSFGSVYPYRDFLKMIYEANHVFCAYDLTENRPIACALVNEVSGKGGLYLMLFGVRPSDQSRGAGTYLLKKIIHWARQAGRTFIYLHVHVENFKAIGLYEKVGFYKYEYIRDFYAQTPKRPADAFQMILSLQ